MNITTQREITSGWEEEEKKGDDMVPQKDCCMFSWKTTIIDILQRVTNGGRMNPSKTDFLNKHSKERSSSLPLPLCIENLWMTIRFFPIPTIRLPFIDKGFLMFKQI